LPALPSLFRFDASDQAEWLLPDGTVQHGTLTELARHAVGDRWLLIAPGERLTLHQVPQPGRKRSLWARAVPYALEDQVAEDIETLHFALGVAPDGDRLPVAVVAHDTLRGWLETCAQAGLTPAAVVPEPLLLPWREGDWSVLLEQRRAVVRTGRWQGFATERDLLELLLNQALAEVGDAKPQRLRVWGGPPLELAEIGLELVTEDALPEPLRLFATGYPPIPTLNLLQGPYSRQAHWGRRHWRVAAVLAGLWLLAHGIAQIHEYWSLQRELVTLRTEMEQVFKDAVPGATRIVNPKVQMETRLRELRTSGSSSGALFELLYQCGKQLTGFPEVALRGFSYRDRQLDLDLEGGNPAVLDQLQQRLNQQTGLHVEMRTTQREGQMNSKVILKRTPS
jgi:general secretion pathway protein L